MSQIYLLVLALIFGAIGTLSFSPYDFWPAAIISLCGLQILLLEKNICNAAVIGFSWGLGLFGTGINWIYISISNFAGISKFTSILLVLLLISYLSLYPMLFSIFFNIPGLKKLSKYHLSLVSPALWHITEYLRGYLFTGFPWLQFGYSQINGPLKYLGPLAGVESITFALMSLAGLITHGIYCRTSKSLILAGIFLLFSLPLNLIKWYRIQPQQYIDALIVQGNIIQSVMWDNQQLFNILHSYRSSSYPWLGKVSFVIWPESAIPDIEMNQQSFLKRMDLELRKHHTALVTGIIDSHNNKNSHDHYNYNSIIVLGNKTPYYYNTNNRYQKNHLVPFGEFVPMQSLINFLFPFFKFPMSSFSRGKYIQSSLKVAGYNVTGAICYEIILGEHMRANFRSNVNFLLSVSNDAWFGNSIAPWQHLQMARMRSLELGRPLLHATNTGITAAVNANGNIEKILPPFIHQTLKVKLSLTSGQTPYSRVGSWPIWILTSIILIKTIIFHILRTIKFHSINNENII